MPAAGFVRAFNTAAGCTNLARNLDAQGRYPEAEELAGGAVRAKEGALASAPPAELAWPALPAGDRPFAHPRFWAAFILIGDPD